MPLVLDDTDIAILRSLESDGRKSFRQIARETKISVPTVAARYERLVNIGLIKSVSVILDLDKIEQHEKLASFSQSVSKVRVKKGTKISLKCDYCHGPISGKPVIFKFAKYERYLCCTSCRDSYKEKHKARIASIVKKAKTYD